MEELQDSLQFVRIRRADLRKQAKGLRKSHLRDCLGDSMEKKQKKRMAASKQTINREESKRMWYLIKQTVRDPQSPSILKVQRVINGKTQEYEIQEDIENAIQQECKIQFSLAHSAPIMTTLPGKRLWYLSNESLAQAIITGAYKIPSDMDPATKLILEEIGKLGVKVVNKEGTENIIIPEDFQRFWKKVGEFPSSSMSGIHYRHYKAAIQCNISTKILAQQLTVVTRSGIPPESWCIGLQVMWEKIAGVCLVKKLHAIQLYKVDFNWYNQFVFGKAAIDSLNSIGYTPKELLSQKGSTSKDAKFDNTLMADLSRQAHHPMTVVFGRCCILLQSSKSHYHVTSMARPNKRKYLSDSSFPECLQTMKFFHGPDLANQKHFLAASTIFHMLLVLVKETEQRPHCGYNLVQSW
jgi:hypothetical protein